MLKKSFILAIFVAFILLFMSCTGFNLFKPKNIDEVIKNLPPDQQVSTAQEALSSAETDEDYINIGDALATEFQNALGDGTADNETEADAAEIIATAYIQASPVGDIIGEIANAQASGTEPDIEGILNNLAEDPESQESLVIGLLNGATFTNLAADYDASNPDGTPDADLQLTNAILNIGAAIVIQSGTTTEDSDGNGTADTATVPSDSAIQDAITTVFDDPNGDGKIGDNASPDALASLTEAKNSLQELTSTLQPDNPVYQLADGLLQMLP